MSNIIMEYVGNAIQGIFFITSFASHILKDVWSMMEKIASNADLHTLKEMDNASKLIDQSYN